jgi:hypothetical protein
MQGRKTKNAATWLPQRSDLTWLFPGMIIAKFGLGSREKYIAL